MGNFLKKIGSRTGRFGRAIAVGAVVFLAGGAAAWLASGYTKPNNPVASEKKEPDGAPKLRRTGADTVVVPSEVQTSLNIKTAAAALPTRKRTLPTFQGKLNFELNGLARIHSPFAGPLIDQKMLTEQFPPVVAGSEPIKVTRLLRPGDKVQKDDVLAVVWSKDLGEKKSEFVDAVSKLKTDEETLLRLELLHQNSGTAERVVREQERTVKADRIAVERAEATLRSWRIPQTEIDLLRAEADALGNPDAKRTDPARWARVEIKSPLAGVVLEKNVAVAGGQVVDTTTELFRIGDLSTLAVWVHLYQEDLQLLRDLKLPCAWKVTAEGLPGITFNGRLEQIASSLDTTQQTALVTGTVENNAKNDLRAGMAVYVHVELDTPKGEIEVPAEAVIEDGRESFVFVRTEPTGDTFVRRPVTVVRRTRDVISVAERPDGIKPGDLVVTSGSLLLGDAFSDLPQPK